MAQDRRRFQRALVERCRFERDRGINRLFNVVGRVTGIEHRLGNGAINKAGVEMRQPVNGRHLLGDGSLAGGSRAVYSDDHVPGYVVCNGSQYIDMNTRLQVKTD